MQDSPSNNQQIKFHLNLLRPSYLEFRPGYLEYHPAVHGI